MEVVVRLSETDMLGIVNNANFFTYMEEGRMDYINKLNVEYGDNEAFIVARTACDYIQQGLHGQTLLVETSIAKVGTKSVTLDSHIYNKKTGDLVAKGETVVVYYRLDLQEAQEIPEKYHNVLKENISNVGSEA